jgi:threonine aldolase
MAEALVGDDVYGEDPTITLLERETAERLGKEAALFVPSGTMANQIALLCHLRPGDEVWAHEASHLATEEQGGVGALASAQLRAMHGADGTLSVAEMERWVRDPTDIHHSPARLVWLENTIAHTGGRILPPAAAREVAVFAAAHDMRVHLDGARIWNAAVASHQSPAEIASNADTVTVCYSKGLGAPVGSAIAGPTTTIASARRARKLLGGGMRQAGIVAAGALFALNRNIDRLAEDHARAGRLAQGLSEKPRLTIDVSTPETNMVIATSGLTPAEEVVTLLAQHGVACFAIAPDTVRFVVHLNLDDDDIDEAIDRIRAALHRR